MESVLLRCQPVTLYIFPFKVACGIFMKLFKKVPGEMSNGPAWWFIEWHLTAEMERLAVSCSRPEHGLTHVRANTPSSKETRSAHTEADLGRLQPDSHMMSLYFVSAEVRTKGHVQHHWALLYISAHKHSAPTHYIMRNICIDFLFRWMCWFLFSFFRWSPLRCLVVSMASEMV